MPQKERRRTKRFHEENVAEIFIFSKNEVSENNPSIAYTENICVDGAKVVCGAYFPVSSKLKISLKLSRSKQTIHLWATVIWTKERNGEDKHEMGLEFVHDAKTIAVLLKHLYGKNRFAYPEKEEPHLVKRIEVA
jgi:hypothetical protein